MNHKKNDYPSSSQQLTMFEREAPYPTPELVAKEASTPKSATPKPDTNANREGYKLTKLGWIPEDWKISSFRQISKINQGLQIPISERYTEPVKDTYFYITNEFLKEDSEKKFYIKDPPKSVLCEETDILMTRTGNTGQIVTGVKGAFHNNFFKIKLSADNERKFIYYFLVFQKTQYLILKLAGTSTIPDLNHGDFYKIKIPLPPLPEQRAIADCLSTWDQAIQTLTQLITQKELRKKWLMQQLLTGKKRLPGFSGDWQEKKLANYFTERCDTGFDHLPLLSVGEEGVYPQTDSNKKDTSNADKSKYKRIRKGDIGYNTMRMWQGRNALSHLEGIISPAYTVVVPRENADGQFFAYLFKFSDVIHKFYRNSQGLVSDTLNCKFKDFAIVKIFLPPTTEEQTAIAQILQRADQEITLLNQKLTHLQNQKKGLMQQLLTGKKRLNLNNK